MVLNFNYLFHEWGSTIDKPLFFEFFNKVDTMNNGYYFQAFSSLINEMGSFTYPRVLKEYLKQGDINNLTEFQDILVDEVASASLADPMGLRYFGLMAETASMFFLYQRDHERLTQVLTLIEKKCQAFTAQGGGDLDQLETLFSFIGMVGRRLFRHATIEEFEETIDELDWGDIDEAYIYRFSSLIGLTYLNESNASHYGRCQMWLRKAVSESAVGNGLDARMDLLDYLFDDRKQDHSQKINEIITEIKNEATQTQNGDYKKLLNDTVLYLQNKALLNQFGNFDDNQVKIEENLRSIRSVEKTMAKESLNSSSFVRAFTKYDFSKYYLSLTEVDLDEDDIKDLLALATANINEAMDIANETQNKIFMDVAKVQWMAVVAERAGKVSEKDLREVVSSTKKTENYPLFARAARNLARFYVNQDNTRKAYDNLLDLIKSGSRRLDKGGFQLIVDGFRMTNDLMLSEIRQPGVSWMVTELVNYFGRLKEIIDAMDSQEELIGRALFDQFREEFVRFEPSSHLNAVIYLKYQWYEVKILRLSFIYSHDAPGQKVTETLLKELEADNNPLSFIQGEWEEFKNVPNSVRNKMLNKCISITKGDLPAAAEHLDFSYRNLRSYITFKEVNRLGFFLDQKSTNNRQLEQGIRLMFFDLYKNGTIFEVVFDMPKFLVEFAKPGFSSQDLEEALNIKGTTAKKYIKIMMEIGMIKHEKSIGRKHFYKLRKENVMNRLGQDRKVLVG